LFFLLSFPNQLTEAKPSRIRRIINAVGPIRAHSGVKYVKNAQRPILLPSKFFPPKVVAKNPAGI
jgi:hypothetical protein